ncbi:MarR family winged helix-turn-helix transcriptional regulator [Paractinoplanes lichenicola]|uniref:MarR family transcriptional regulator n=1 Tax=Paractinoplanes lichenicola TaxID=2802976 RepID=A0ABS1VGU1_9ACTN|nr:MarR family transcriptional regulator [Actinoplanes lichenicola]MBL7253379.1 MarR family transcriptional regulator [Actinoplanes lichenicola]
MEPETCVIDRWRTLLSRYNAVASALERALQEEHALTLSDFETLDRLAEAMERPRMQELAASMYLSQSALSRTVARLEKAGLVERIHCVADRRGVVVELTEAGRQRHKEARVTHLAVLSEHLADAEDRTGAQASF